MFEKRIVGMIVPDVHEQIEKVKKVLAKYPEQWVVFLGDWFDSFDNDGAPTRNTFETCAWIRDNISNSLYTFLWGNHDLSYVFEKMRCSGWNPRKLEIIRNHLGDTDKGWKRFKLMHWLKTPTQNYLCSHAGLHPYLLHPVMGFDKTALLSMEEEAMYKIRHEQTVTPLLEAGQARGGPSRIGGVVWLDWNLEFKPIEGLYQIIGHTPGKSVRTKVMRKNGLVVSHNYNLDTHLNHVILVYDDGTLEIESTK